MALRTSEPQKRGEARVFKPELFPYASGTNDGQAELRKKGGARLACYPTWPSGERGKGPLYRVVVNSAYVAGVDLLPSSLRLTIAVVVVQSSCLVFLIFHPN